MPETPDNYVKILLSFEEWIIEMKCLVEDKILYSSRLKGIKIPSGYRTYAIIDVDGLISELADALVQWGEEGTIQRENQILVGNVFRKIKEELNLLAKVWSVMTEVNPGNHLRRIKKELKAWEKKIKARIPHIERLSSLGIIADKLVGILRSHVLAAPNTTIADRVSDLLKLIDVEMASEAIRKRITRKATT